MSAGAELPWLKALEVGVLLAAGIGFCWWQLRDVAREQARRRRERDEGAPEGSQQDAPTTDRTP